MKPPKHVKGKNHVNYSLQSFFDYLHVNYMLFTYSVNFQLFQCLYKEKSNVQKYVDNVWLSCSFRWAKCMRKRQVLNIVDTNNGTEAQNKTFKNEYLPLSLDKSVYGISVMLVEGTSPTLIKGT